MKRAVKFNVGDKVFAKVKGYPAWPAIILQDHKVKYNVKFFGTGETANVKPKDVYYYLKYKKTFHKSIKRKDYNDAIAEIENAIQECGTDGNTEGSSTANNSVSSNLNDTVDSTKSNKRKRSINKDKVSSARSKRSASDATSIENNEDKESSKQILDSDSDETTEELANSHEESEMSPSEDMETENNQEENENESNEARRKTKLSNIKLSDEEFKVVTIDFLKVILSYAEHVRKHKEAYQQKPIESRPRRKEVVMAKLKSEDYIGIKLNRESPSHLKNEFEQATYDEAEVKRVLILKTELENGACNPENIPELLESNFVLNEKQVEHHVELDLIERKKAKLKWLTKESSLIELDAKIKACLGLDKADPKAALEHLSTMSKMEVDPLMLKKHPHVVDMVKRLRRYIGNVKEWNMDEDEQDKFEIQAAHVRDKAEEVFTNFAKLFKIPDTSLFWDSFSKEVDDFKHHVKDMKESHMYALSSEPNSRQAFFDRIDDEDEMKIIVAKLEKSNKLQKENSNQVAESDNEQSSKTTATSTP